MIKFVQYVEIFPLETQLIIFLYGFVTILLILLIIILIKINNIEKDNKILIKEVNKILIKQDSKDNMENQ